MSDFIKNFEKKNKPQIQKYKKYIKDNDWSQEQVTRNSEGNISSSKYYFIKDVKVGKEVMHEGKEPEYKVQDKIVQTVVDRLKYFVESVEADIGKSVKVDRLIKSMRSLIDLHLKRIDGYISSNSVLEDKEEVENDDKKTQRDFKSEEIEFDNLLYKNQANITDKVKKLNLERDVNDSILELYDDVKAPLSMRGEIEKHFPDVRKRVEAMNLDFDSPPKNEMFIHIENPPEWNEDKHYFEQEKKVLQFYIDEYKKIKNGITIDGIYISPWMYCHLNVFKTDVPIPHKNEHTGEIESKDVTMNPPLRDNEWFIIQDSYEKAKRDGELLFLCATRRAAKTTLISSHMFHKGLSGGKELVVAGGSAKDLGQIEKNFRKAVLNAHPSFKLPNISNDWTKKVKLGVKKKNQKDIIQCILNVVNLNSGGEKSSEVLAGFTPDAFVLDECMKSPFIDQLNAAKPAFDSPYGKRCTPLLSGCVCAGTKVWDNKGNLVNIEDLKPENGILGYDLQSKKISQEEITYWQPPHEKPCYKITTNKGRTLECSDDHPILFRSRNETTGSRKNRKRKIYFKEAKDLKVGEHIIVAESIPFEGTKEMWNPRLIGLLIGDGSYGKNKTPVMSNCDEEINSYIYNNFDCIEESGYKTKTNKDYKETRIRGIRPELKKLGIAGQSKCNKTLPLEIHSYREEDICELLGGFFDADGHVVADGRNYSINLSSGCKNILNEVLLLLQKIGIHCNINFKKPREENPKDKNGHYVLNISDRKSVLQFHKKITFMVKHKQNKLEECVKELTPKKNRIPREFRNIRLEKVTSVEYIGIKPVYNLTAGTTNTYIANGIITHNTGSSNDALTQDAFMILQDPSSEEVSEMNWDALERNIPEDYITWKRRSFGTFLPAQMSAKDGMVKIKTNLAEYLNIENPKKSSDIEINVTDWKHSLEIIKSDRKKKEKNKPSLTKEIVYYPIDPEEIFLSGKPNPFPREELKLYKQRLIASGDIGKNVVLDYDDKTGKVIYEISEKELAPYPYKGGFHDAPVTIYEDPLPNAPFEFYLSSLDDYKQEQSDSDSVGSFSVIRRDNGRLVATYHSRPDPHSKLHRQGLLLLEMYGAPCFMENADISFIEYCNRLDRTEEYILKQVDFLGDMSWNVSGKKTYGWTPTPKNISFLLNMFITLMKKQEEYEDENGKIKTRWGFERVKDISILDEMINYKEGGNFDRITSLMGAYGYDYYLQITYGAPKPIKTEEQKRLEAQRAEERKKKMTKRGMFPKSRRSMFPNGKNRNY